MSRRSPPGPRLLYLAATGIPLTALSPEETKRLPHYALVPAGLIGSLAVAQQCRGQGLGGALVIDAVKRSVRSDPAIFALMVDAKDEMALAFYRHLGFVQLRDRPLTLYLPIATALKALDDEVRTKRLSRMRGRAGVGLRGPWS